eukprot:2427703-Alexandrium_andersonii.AAC.1
MSGQSSKASAQRLSGYGSCDSEGLAPTRRSSTSSSRRVSTCAVPSPRTPTVCSLIFQVPSSS